jgi:ABC-2 type transport system permease protein
MKLWGIFRFELAYQVRRPWPWLIFAVLFVFSFLWARDATLAEALYEEFFVNSPFAIAKTTVMVSLIWLLIAPIVAGEAAARDVATGMHPLTYTVPIRRIEYLGGRFLAALVLNAAILSAVPAGILLAVYSPGVAAELIGPFRPAAYLTAYGYLTLPTAFAATAIQFALASGSGRPMAGYLGSLLLFFMAYVVGIFLITQGRQDLARLLDPIGVVFILDALSHLWTTVEKSVRLIALEGVVLRNRLLWLGVGTGALAVTWARFRFAHRTAGGGWRRRSRRGDALAPPPAGVGVAAGAPISVPHAPRTFGLAIRVRQTLAIAWTSFRTIAKSWAGLALLAAIPAMSVLIVIDQMTSGGVPLVPSTARVLAELTGPLALEMSRWVMIPLLLVYFAGELVWRERDAGMGEITDAAPVPEWVPFLGKLLGLGLVLLVFQLLLAAAGMLAQAILGHDRLEAGLYLKVMLGLQLPEYLLFALFALVVHGVVNQKYVAHLVAIIAYVLIALAGMFGIEHNLLIYGAGPRWSYTEMSGFGPSLGPWLWFKLYWAAWAALLAAVAMLLWARGREGGLAARLQLARRRLAGPTGRAAAVAVALVGALGGFIFYNTNVLNAYRASSDVTRLRAEYEHRYKRYEAVPQPRLTATRLRVEIHPERREMEIRGAYHLRNGSGVAIDSIHLSVPGVAPVTVGFDRPAALAVADDERGHRVYALRRPLQPGDSLRLDFRMKVEPHGFGNRGVDASVAENGTWFTVGGWLPDVGYQRSRELISAGDRREHGLPARPVIPSLYDVEERMQPAERAAFEAVVGTSADQVAVAPGQLRRTWTEGGRRYFHYAADGGIGDEHGFFSARYAVHEARWNGVAIQVFHHPGHTRNLGRIVRGVRASLDYYTTHFGPYPRGYLSLVERPGEGTGMHANGGMITYAGGFDSWGAEDGPGSFDHPSAIVAHEMAHQWTLPYAAVEGAPVLSESVAWYYGMQVVRASYGEAQLRRLLKWMRQPHMYPPIRRGEPLLRGLDPYMSYRRGPFALFALSEYMGVDRVNTALRRLNEAHRSGEPPLATTLDLYRELHAVAPDSLKPLLHDFFEVNTVWELAMEDVTARRTAAGAWEVTLDVTARKVVADSAGVETEAPMAEWVEIGVFAPVAEGQDRLGAPLYLRKHRIRSGGQTITLTVPREPFGAGIDPFHLLDWVEKDGDDNLRRAEVAAAAAPGRR